MKQYYDGIRSPIEMMPQKSRRRTTIGKQFIGIVDKSIASTIQWNSEFLRVFVAFLFFCELKKPQWKAHLNVGVPCFVFPRRATTNWCFNKWSSLGDDVFPSSNCWGVGVLWPVCISAVRCIVVWHGPTLYPCGICFRMLSCSFAWQPTRAPPDGS